MSVERSLNETVESIVSGLSSHDLSESDKQKITQILSEVLVKTVETTTDHNLKTTVRCCGPEADLAHQIRNEVNLKKDMLIANLMGPR